MMSQHSQKPELEELRSTSSEQDVEYEATQYDDECYVIHEAEDPDLDENVTQELYETELEHALEKEFKLIVIEPKSLGDRVARWIQVGNFLHKTSVLCSLGSLISPLILPQNNRTIISLSLGGTSLAFSGLYNISWQFDPCCKYQVEYDNYNLSKVPLESLSSPSPVVLVHKDDKYRKKLHNIGALAVTIYMGYKAYQHWFSS